MTTRRNFFSRIAKRAATVKHDTTILYRDGVEIFRWSHFIRIPWELFPENGKYEIKYEWKDEDRLKKEIHGAYNRIHGLT